MQISLAMNDRKLVEHLGIISTLLIIAMEACTVNSLLSAQNLTSVLKCFDPDCSSHENVCKPLIIKKVKLVNSLASHKYYAVLYSMPDYKETKAKIKCNSEDGCPPY